MPTTYNFTVKVTDAQGLTCEKPQSITVDSGGICPASFGSIAGGIGAPLANVGVRSGASNLLFCGNISGNTVAIIDTTTNLSAGSANVGAADAYGVIYVPTIGGAGNPTDIIYALNSKGDLYTIDIDSFAVTLIDAQGMSISTFQNPVYASTAKALFYATTQGTGITRPTATLLKYPLTAGVPGSVYVDVDGGNAAALTVSHYTPTNDTVWFATRDLGGLNTLNAMNASTNVVGAQITLSLASRSAQGIYCSANGRFYVPCYPGGSVNTGPFNLDVFTAAGTFVHSLTLPYYCRGVVFDSTGNRIIALCENVDGAALRCFTTGDAFICDLAYVRSFWGEHCPENTRTYIAAFPGTTLGIIG